MTGIANDIHSKISHTTPAAPTTNTMSSGRLPYGHYHRAQALGEGTYGSVVCVYNDAGEELALKVFDPDEGDHILWMILFLLRYFYYIPNEFETNRFCFSFEDNDTMELGTLREISILRILRGDNGHPNVVSSDNRHLIV